MSRAVFLDKDGTLVENVPYNVDLVRIRLAPGAGPALRGLVALGYELVVITNQSGVARGLFPEAALAGVERQLARLLETEGVRLSGFYYCPHHPEGSVGGFAHACECRKPLAGLLQRAADDHAFDLSQSWMVGDILNDVEAGHLAGCRSILIDNGGETEWEMNPLRTPDFIARNLEEAASQIRAATPAVLQGARS